LGELVAGIAHEINNPINFIYGNIIHLERYSKSLLDLIDKYSQTDDSLPEDKKGELQAIKKEIDIDFLKEDIKDLLESCKEGTERTKKIIADLKNFSRLEDNVLIEFDIAREIDTTLNILRNKLKNRITIHKNYPDDLPKIEVYGGQLNQVFMNILDNAQYAIDGTGDIFIDVVFERKNVIIEIRDTGKGIDQKNLNKIFEPFFTTKPIGEGTGLGLSIAYKVVQNYGGTMDVKSEIGKGTNFKIVLPISPGEDKNG
jgi:signal transduction histidine kinase